MDEKAAEFKKTLQENEKVIVYCDADEFPNTMFLTNSGIMKKCEKLLGDNYKVIYVFSHKASNWEVSRLVQGSVNNMSPCIVLYKNGVEVTRSGDTFYSSSFREAPKMLADWIREQFK